MRRKKYNEFVFTSDYAEMIIKHKDNILKVKLDLEDVEKVKELGSWHAIYDSTLQTPSYYICHRKVNQKCYKLHRFITNCPEDMEVDHINHDTLDNRKSNLRVCTHFENQQNLRSKSTEKTGVYQRKNGRWVASISKNKERFTKEFKYKEDAIKYRKQMELELYGKEVA